MLGTLTVAVSADSEAPMTMLTSAMFASDARAGMIRLVLLNANFQIPRNAESRARQS